MNIGEGERRSAKGTHTGSLASPHPLAIGLSNPRETAPPARPRKERVFYSTAMAPEPESGDVGSVGDGLKVVLSTPPWKTTELWPPLGLLYIAASNARQRNDELMVIDAFCENLTKEQLVERVRKEQPDVFGINCSTHTFLVAIETLREIRKALPETVLVMGGFHATFAAERIVREYPFVNYVIKGEAERAFPQLLHCIESGKKPAEVEGISFLDNGSYLSNPAGHIEDLDALPFPARHLASAVEYGYFHQNIRLTYGKFTTISTSRGCPYACTYCSCAAFSERKWRPRSAENVVTELEGLYSDGYECCVVVDDNFTVNKGRVEKICDLIRQKRIRMQFYCEGRVDRAPYSLLRKMKQAGFTVMYYGVESGTQHVLDYYRKGITLPQAAQAVADAKRAGMIVVTSYIVGAPIESREDILRTFEFVRKTRPHGIQLNILDCLIGTPLWEVFSRHGIVGPDDWKTNHRIYEYYENGLSKAELERLVDLGYTTHVDAWKNKHGAKELLQLLFTNGTARKVILHNAFNPNARQRAATGQHEIRH